MREGPFSEDLRSPPSAAGDQVNTVFLRETADSKAAVAFFFVLIVQFQILMSLIQLNIVGFLWAANKFYSA